MAEKILIYSPYSDWWLHTLYEITIAHGLRLRGADVKFVCCRGSFLECDVAWEAVRPRTENTCSNCLQHHQYVFEKHDIETEWLTDYFPHNAVQEASTWVSRLKTSDLLDAHAKGCALGSWVRSSVHSHLKISQIDFNDRKIVSTYRRYLYGAYLTMLALENAYARYQPDVLLTLNGRFFSHRVAMELAKLRGIRTVIHERSQITQSICLWEEEKCQGRATLDRSWSEWKDIPLTAVELRDTERIFMWRETGKNTGWKPFSVAEKPIDTLRQELGLSAEKKVVSLFTSTDDELCAIDEWTPIMDQEHWLIRTKQWFASHPDINLVVRIHPNVLGSLGNNYQALQTTLDAFSNAPDNIKIVMPDQQINSYQLLSLSSACLVHSSTVGIEASLRGVPSLYVGGGHFFGREFAYNLSHSSEYESLLERICTQNTDPRHRKFAYRFGYQLFVRRAIRFPLVRMVEVSRGELTYSNINELLPGRDDDLDRICDSLINNSTFYPPPSKEHTWNSAEEEEFLKTQFGGHGIDLQSDLESFGTLG